MLKIDGHGHLLPYPQQIPAFMREQRLFWVDDDRQFMRQGDWKRPITDASFFLNEKLEWMAKHGMDHEVILNLSQLYCNGMPRRQANDVIRFQNDFNAGVQRDYPSKFTCGFVVQAAWVDDALREIERCVHELGLQLLCLPTHFLTPAGQWKTIADQSVEPIFELADKLNLALEIHPYDGEKMIALEDRWWRFHLIWMCAQTADTYHFYTLFDYPEKYPNLRVCFAHGNQFGQVNVGRRVQGFEARPDLFEGAMHPLKSQGTKNLFYDTIVHDLVSLELLIKRQGVSQIVAGIDDPYPLGEMETVPGSYPGKVIDIAAKEGLITLEEREAIWSTNVVRWLCGEEEEKFWKRTGLNVVG